jgi:uncharacterized protein (TIGR02996 family)
LIGVVSWEDHVRAIRLEPESDAPRLVCADWLVERGEARGEYVALACRAALLDRGSAEWVELTARRHAIAREAEWAGPIGELGAKSARFHRGFVERVVLVGRDALNLPALCAMEPIVDVEIVSAGARNYARIAEMPELAQLRSLEVTGQYMVGYEALVDSPVVANIPALRVGTRAIRGTIPDQRSVAVDAEIAAAVVAGSALSELRLWHADDAAICALATAPLAGLHRLTLCECELTRRAIDALGDRLDRVEHLAFERTTFTAAMAEALAAAMPSGNLRSLQHSGAGDGIAAFVSTPAFRGVAHLDLQYAQLDVAAIERSPHRGGLRKLSYGWGKPNDIRIDLPGVELDNNEEGW